MSEEPRTQVKDTVEGSGYAVGSLDGIGEGPGFRKIRKYLGVTAFGINAVVMPSGYSSGRHYHDKQEETYFIHQGEVEFEFDDGTRHLLGPGGLARVDAHTVRRMKNVGDGEAILVVAGGQGGYVGRDGHAPPGEPAPKG